MGDQEAAVVGDQESIIFDRDDILIGVAGGVQEGARNSERDAATPLRGSDQAENHDPSRFPADQDPQRNARCRDPAADPVPGEEKIARRPSLEIAPQRPLKLATGANYSAVGIMASRVHLKIQAYHDGELVAFLDEFPRIHRGFFPIDKCSIKRTAGAEQRTAAVTTDAALVATRIATPVAVVAAIEADCTLEWITMVDMSKPANLQASSETRKPL